MKSALVIAFVWAIAFILAMIGVAAVLSDGMKSDAPYHYAVLEGAVYR